MSIDIKGNEMDITTLPVAMIGAGPIGLAAAEHLIQQVKPPDL